MLHYCNIRDENLKNALIQILQRDPKYKIEQYLTNNLNENNVQSLPYLTVSRALESLGFQVTIGSNFSIYIIILERS